VPLGLHVPGCAWIATPTSGVDVEIVGGEVLAGGAGAIGPTVAESAVEEPEFDSVTSTSGNRPTSLEVGV
jgi:hypothetical protein